MNDCFMLMRFGFGISLIKLVPSYDVQYDVDKYQDIVGPFESILDFELPNTFYLLEECGQEPSVMEFRMSLCEEFDRMVDKIHSKGSESHKNRLIQLQQRYSEYHQENINGTDNRVLHGKSQL